MQKQMVYFRSNKLILVMLVVVFCFSALPVSAAEKDAEVGSKIKSCYRLIPQEVYSGPPGKPSSPDNKHPVCKVLLNNLNEFCDEKPPNMVCEFKIHPRYKTKLSVPKWTKLDIYKNLDRIEAMVRSPFEIYESTAQNKSYQDEAWQKYYTRMKKGLDEGTATLHSATFDLRNLGRSYDVLRVQHEKCTGQRIILNLHDDPKVAAYEFEPSWLDVEYSALALKQIIPPSIIKIGTMKDIFFFQGETFSYNWSENKLSIYRPFRGKNGGFNIHDICWIEYDKH